MSDPRWQRRSPAILIAALLAGCSTSGVVATGRSTETAATETAATETAATDRRASTARSDPPTAGSPAAATSVASTSAASTLPAFAFGISELDEGVRARMIGRSWRDECPMALEDLRYVTVSHIDLDGTATQGELVVHAAVAHDVVAVFERLYDARFPIDSMRLVDDFDGDDNRSMAANNTSAFNCRFVKGTDDWSDHAFGLAIDINPLLNPAVIGATVDPPAGSAYVDRTLDTPGMILDDGPAVAAFADVGWEWGGTWAGGPDYQHFSSTGS